MNRNFLLIGVMRGETSGQQRQTCRTLGSRGLHEFLKSGFGNNIVLWANHPQVRHVPPTQGAFERGLSDLCCQSRRPWAAHSSSLRGPGNHELLLLQCCCGEKVELLHSILQFIKRPIKAATGWGVREGRCRQYTTCSMHESLN